MLWSKLNAGSAVEAARKQVRDLMQCFSSCSYFMLVRKSEPSRHGHGCFIESPREQAL